MTANDSRDQLIETLQAEILRLRTENESLKKKKNWREEEIIRHAKADAAWHERGFPIQDLPK